MSVSSVTSVNKRITSRCFSGNNPSIVNFRLQGKQSVNRFGKKTEEVRKFPLSIS
jgi:hypothetical protein